MIFDVCNTCSAGLANDDWTHLDYFDPTGEAVAVAMASVESMGLVSPVDTVGYAFDCFVCGCTEYAGTAWERV